MNVDSKNLLSFAKRDPENFKYMLEKSLCQESLADFIKTFWPVLEPVVKLKWGWAMDAMCEHLEAVSNNQIDNLKMNVPPGMLKSLMTSVFWPSWEWGPRKMPHLRYVLTSYKEGLAKRDNMKARRLIKSDKFRQMFGDEFDISKSEVDTQREFHTDATGFRFCVGAQGGVTGYRGDRIIIDDPHSVKGGESEADRHSTVMWFSEELYNRVNDPETAKRVLIMQRIHESDVSGHIDETLGDDWVSLVLPMRFEEDRRCHTVIGFTDPREKDGDLLFPERFTENGVDKLELGMMSFGGEYAVAGQMQQRPAPRGGGMFKISKLHYCDVAPAGGKPCRGWDLAGSIKKNSPYTAGVQGKLVGGNLYIMNVARFRKAIYDAEASIVGICRDDTRVTRQSLPQDPGQAGLSQVNNLSEKLIGLDFLFTPESGAKEDRAIPFASYVNAGKVYLVKGDWNKQFVAELSTFPRGNFKDQVDGASRMFTELQRMPVRSSKGPRGKNFTGED